MTIENDLYIRFLTAEILEREQKKKDVMTKLNNPEVKEIVDNVESNYILGLYKAMMLYLDFKFDLSPAGNDEQSEAAA